MKEKDSFFTSGWFFCFIAAFLIILLVIFAFPAKEGEISLIDKILVFFAAFLGIGGIIDLIFWRR
jgi:hypothetical protein